jgi:hypothetical protein
MVILLVAVGAIAQAWIIPGLIRQAVVRELPEYWQGHAEIREIEFSFFRPIVLRGVTLLDEKRQRWLYAESIEFKLEGWPGIHPVLTRIEVDRPDVQLYWVDGRCRLPIRTDGEKEETSNSYVDLQGFNVRDLCLAAVNGQGLKTRWDGLDFSALRSGPVFNLRLTRLGAAGVNNLLIEGTLDPDTLETRLSLDMGCEVDSERLAPLLAVLDFPILREAGGKLMGGLTVSGKLSEPGNLRWRGLMNMNDCRLGLFEGLEVTNLNAVVRIEGRRIDFERLTAESCRGKVEGDLYVSFPRGEGVAYGGKLAAEGVDMDVLTRGIPALPRMEQGRGTAHYSFTMEGGDIEKLQAVGLLTLDDAHLWNLPVILQIFNQFKIANRDPMGISDVAALFAMKGAETVFHRAVLANALSAIEMERGGRVNLATHAVDLYVVGVPLKVLRQFISAIPLVKLVVPLRDRFTRLHLKGDWSDPSSALIFRAPFSQLHDAMRDFLTVTARTEGQFDAETLKVFEKMFDELAGKKSK